MSGAKCWNAILCSGAAFEDPGSDSDKFRSHFGNLSQSFHLTALIGSGASLAAEDVFAGPSMSVLVDVVKTVKDFETVLQWAGRTMPPKDIEVFLSECERLKELPTKPEPRSNDIDSMPAPITPKEGADDVPKEALALTASQKSILADFLDSAKQGIRTRCDFLDGRLPDSKKPFDLSAHEKFLRCFGRRGGRKSRLKLFTTNYDLCFEKAAGRTNFVLLDGFSFTFPRRFSTLNYGLEIAQKSGQSSESLEPIENLAQLFKLHGSVNWAIQDGCVVMDAAPKELCVIQPSSAKYQQAFQQPYLEMISHYLEAMRKLDQTLIVAGFGFADAHLVAPIESALASSSKFRLVVVDPFLEKKLTEGKGFYGTLKRWMGLGDQRITLVNATFSEFMSLVPELHQKSEAEQLADAVRRIAMPAKDSF